MLKSLVKLLVKAKAKESSRKIRLKHESELAKNKFMMKLIKNALQQQKKMENSDNSPPEAISSASPVKSSAGEERLKKMLEPIGGLTGLLSVFKNAQIDLVSQLNSNNTSSKESVKRANVKPQSQRKAKSRTPAAVSSNYGVIPDFFHMDFSGKKGLPDKCGLCQMQFASDYMLVHHVKFKCATEADIRGETDVLGSFPCSQCDMVLLSRLRLMVHEIRKHSDSGRKYKCDQCEKSYKKCDTLIWHRRQAHMSLRLFKCEECGNEFCYKSALDRHLKIHKGVKYSCTECNISYDSHSSYEYHMRKHKGLSYLCEVCGFRSWERRRIRKHYESNHPEHTMSENSLSLQPGADGSAAIADAALKRNKILQEKGRLLAEGSYVGAGTSRPRKPTRGRNIIKAKSPDTFDEQVDQDKLNNVMVSESHCELSSPNRMRNVTRRQSSQVMRETPEIVAPIDLDGLEYAYEFPHSSTAPATIEIVSDGTLHPLNTSLPSQNMYSNGNRNLSPSVSTSASNYYTSTNGIHFTSGQLTQITMPLSGGNGSTYVTNETIANDTFTSSQCKLCHDLVDDLPSHYSSFHKLAPDVTVLFCC